MFTEKLTSFIERKKEITMLGFAWAIWWRINLFFLLIEVSVVIFVILILILLGIISGLTN